MTSKFFIRLGLRQGWGGIEAPFHISADALRQHMYVVGKSGTGKSTLLKSLFLQLALSNRGVALLDPHGDLSEELLDLLPQRLARKVVYFNLSDISFPVAWNIVAHVPSDERHKVASGIVSAFKHIWGDISWGPRLQDILDCSLRALLDAEHTTILGLTKLLTDPAYRDWILRQVEDPAIQSFWEQEFGAFEKRYRQEAVAPVLNKIRTLSTNPILRNVVGQMRNKVDIRSIMDGGHILIVNLSKASIGSEASGLLGSLLISEFERAAMERAALPEAERRDFVLIADEFQCYATTAFASILSEARKFKLSLVISHQFTSQLTEGVQDAVFGNVGTMVAFQIGYADAEIMAREYAETCAAIQFADLDRFRVLIKPCKVDGSDLPFRAKTEPINMPPTGAKRDIVQRSRDCFATPRLKAEVRIRRWMERWRGI